MRFARFRDSGLRGTSAAQLPPQAFEIRFNVTSVTGTAASTKQITATVYDQFGAVYAGATLVWTTSNAAVATVNSSGLVTFVGKGTAVVGASVTATRCAKAIPATTT